MTQGEHGAKGDRAEESACQHERNSANPKADASEEIRSCQPDVYPWVALPVAGILRQLDHCTLALSPEADLSEVSAKRWSKKDFGKNQIRQRCE